MKKKIDIARMKDLLDADPKIKKAAQEALEFDRQTMSKILSGVRKIEAGELLTIAEVCGVDPRFFEIA